MESAMITRPVQSLVTLENAATALATITDLSDVMDIRDRAEAIRQYTKASQKGLEAQNGAARIKLLAERRAGELIREMQNDGRLASQSTGRPVGEVSQPAILKLDDVGLTADQSSRFQRVAKLSSDELEELAEECNREGRELTQALAIKTATGAHVGHNSGENEWYTPKEYIDAARECMGGIDLDPASSETANVVVGAANYFDEDSDGLRNKWSGNVWMNPPYAQPLMGQFAEKMAESVDRGDVKAAVVLVNNATETKWFQRMAGSCSAICFPSGRVRFWAPDRKSAQPLQGQAVLYFGQNAEGFERCFSSFGFVVTK